LKGLVDFEVTVGDDVAGEEMLRMLHLLKIEGSSVKVHAKML
jgi:hypothetical protein